MHSHRSIVSILCACILAAALCLLPGCNSTAPASSQSSEALPERQGTSFTLGNLGLTIYDQEIVVDTGGRDCLAIHIRVTNRGTEAESIMGTYNISRSQGAATHLKVAVAYDTNGNSLHTANERIEPGQSADVVMCFVLQNKSPVTIVFGNKNRGVTETVMTFPVVAPPAEK